MKSTRTDPEHHPRWQYPNTGATNESGWTGLPGGYRGHSATGYFGSLGSDGRWWTISETAACCAWAYLLHFDHSKIEKHNFQKGDSLSVRCIRN